MTSVSNQIDPAPEKPGHRYLAIAWLHNGCYAYGLSDDRLKALQRCKRRVRSDFGVKGSFRANVYDTGGEIVSFNRYVNVWDEDGHDITDTGEIVEVL
ncbi:MAG: hypothetical protein KF849_13330 [Rhizobiaceae bacterium]|nr:hypothetical protein [Rhizobiaceae bacterium]